MKNASLISPLRASIRRHALRAIVLALLLSVACMAGALAATHTVNTDSRVYRSPSLASDYAALPKGMQVNLVATNGGWAMIENAGIYGYTNAAHLTANAAAPAAEAVVFNVDSYVFQSPDLSSAYLPVPKGMQVELIAVNGQWAMVRNGSVYAYTNVDHLSKPGEVSPTATPAPTAAPTAAPAAEAVVFNVDSYVFQSPDLSSAYLPVPKGMQVELIAVNGQWAMVRNGSVYAYTNVDHLSSPGELSPTATPAPTATPTAAPAAETVVFNVDSYVFQSPDLSSAYLPVPKGMQVELIAVNGQWAMVRNGSVYAYTNVDHLSKPGELSPTATPAPTATPTAAPTATPAPTPDYSELLPNAKDAVITANTFVFQTPDLSGNYVSVAAGLQVRLLAVNGQWALIECNGNYGFVFVDHVAATSTPTATPAPTVAPTPVPTAAPTPAPTAAPDGYLDSSDYSNEQKCYLFLTREMGLNTAAASGILANIYKECSFNPDAGSSYYGICQWGGGRLSNLKSFCSSNGYSVSSLEGQLRFLAYELSNSYPSVLSDLQAVANTPDGAYDAGYLFCYDFERPANRVSSSETRGALARDTYFPRYA